MADTPLLSLPNPVNPLDGLESVYLVDPSETPRDRRISVATLLTSALPVKASNLRVNAAGTLVNGLYRATGTYNPPSIAASGNNTTTVAVAGAAVGDTVLVKITDADLDGIIVTGRVTSTNTVTVRYNNPTSAAVDPPNHTYSVVVIAF